MGSILVIGSTGNVGRSLTAELAGAGERVRAATRNPSKLHSADGIEPVRFDYTDPDTFTPALEGVDRVFMIGPPEAAPQRNMIRFLETATRNERKFVLMTSMGTETSDAEPLRQVEIALERSDMPYVILRPNWFMDNFHTAWLVPIRDRGVIPLPAAGARTSLIDSRDIAASAAAALRTDRFDRSAFTLTGPESLTYEEATTTLSKAAGRDIRYVAVDDESFIKSFTDAGAPAELARYLATLFVYVRNGATAPVSPAVEQITGRSPRTLAQYARDHAWAWTTAAAAGTSTTGC